MIKKMKLLKKLKIKLHLWKKLWNGKKKKIMLKNKT
jgi:hypothetical protein